MSDDDRIVETFTELAPRYEEVVDAELSAFWGWRYSDFADHLLEMTPINHEDRVLDVATGTAVIPRKLQGRLGNDVPIHGLDITPAMLSGAQHIVAAQKSPHRFCFVCASAMEMPYQSERFDVVTCGLATHHMDAQEMLNEMYRVLRSRGQLSIADAGLSSVWNFPGIKLLLKLAAFVYYIFKENLNRAWAEAKAVSNIRLVEEWHEMLAALGFTDIKITRLRSKYFWIPKPMLIRATKHKTGV